MANKAAGTGSLTGQLNVYDVDFGHGVDLEKHLIGILKSTNGLLSHTEAQIITRQFYETNFGIYNHFSTDSLHRPLAIVAMHEHENLENIDDYDTRLDTYVDFNIWDYFHIDIIQYTKLPRNLMIKMLKKAKEEIGKKEKKINDFEKDMKVN